MSIKKSVVIASLGTLIEYYDYSIFSMFLPFLAPTFFAAASEYDALIMGFYAILIASVARPLGGVIFGAIGDRFGRRAALLSSLYGIAIATLIIGILPGHQVIGVYAAIIIIVIRSIQMICYGGEYSGAGVYVVELAQGKNESLLGAILSAMALVGSVVASLVGMGLTMLSPNAPQWRVAFILGGLLGLLAIYLRKDMSESVSKSELGQSESLWSIFKLYPREIFAGICIGGFITVPFSTVLGFINPVLKTQHVLTGFGFMSLQFVLSITAVVILIASGYLADKITPSKVMRLSSLALVVLAIPLGFMIQSMVLWVVIVAEIVLVIINEFLFGPSNAYLKQLFPANCRYRGVAFSFCVGMSLFGGLTPLVENWLYQYSGSFVMISCWLIFVGGLTYLSIKLVDRRIISNS